MAHRLPLVLFAVVVLTAASPPTHSSLPASSCANAKTFVDLLVQDESNSTGFISGRYSCVEGLLSLWVTNVWYEFRCHEKKQTYKAIRDAWRRQGGSNLVLRDRVDMVVADFRMLSNC